MNELDQKLNAYMKEEIESWQDISWKIFQKTPEGAFWYIPDYDDAPADDNIIEGETGEKFYLSTKDAAWQWCGSEIDAMFDAPDFDALAAAIERMAEYPKEVLEIVNAYINYTFLPTWGPEPSDPESVWSWDETRVLVGSEPPYLKVENRYDIEED